MNINGFYTGYMTRAGGNGVGIFVMRDGVIVGCDMAGVTFDGTYIADDAGGFTGTTTVKYQVA